MWEKVKPVQIALNYNDGVVEFFKKEQLFDEYNTPIRGSYSETMVYEDWFRRLGVTVTDVYYSSSDGSKVTEKIAIKGNVSIGTDWSARIENKHYEVYRCYYDYDENETEISLAEVGNNRNDKEKDI